jgi:hypothetical protein
MTPDNNAGSDLDPQAVAELRRLARSPLFVHCVADSRSEEIPTFKESTLLLARSSTLLGCALAVSSPRPPSARLLNPWCLALVGAKHRADDCNPASRARRCPSRG